MRIYAVESTFYDLSQGELDAERVCDQARLGGGTAVRLGVHSQQGHVYYPSEVAPLAPGYELGRDYVAEFIAAAERRGLGMAFALGTVANAEIAAARPEWCQIAADGRPHTWGHIPVLCPNSDYLEYLTDLVREFVAHYAPDCLFFEGFAVLDGCRCSSCVRALAKDAGLALTAIPPGSEESRRYAAWRFERTERLAWQIAMAAKSLKGDAQVVFTGCGWLASRDRAVGWRPEATVDWMDGLHSEFAPRWYGHDFSEGELLGAYQRALGKRGWLWLEYSPLPFSRLACPPAELRAKAATIIAAGAQPCVWPMVPMPPGEDAGLSHLGAFLAQFDDAEEALGVEGSFARTGIIHSRRAAETGRPPTDEVTRAWCNALTRQHILWEFVLDRHLEAGALGSYRLLVIPDTPYLAPNVLAAIEAFVRTGGAALFIGQATRWSRQGELLPDFAAAAMLGVSAVGGPEATPRATPGYLRVAAAPLSALAGRLVPSGPHIPVRLAGADPLAHAIPGPEHHGLLARDEEMSSPGITWRMLGGGKVAYVASRLEQALNGKAGPAFPLTERLIGELVRWLGGERVRVMAPPHVTVQVHRVPRGATVHIVNKPPADGYVSEHVTPTGRLDLVVPQTLFVANVRALDNTAVTWRHRGDRLSISVSGVEEYRCLCIEGALG